MVADKDVDDDDICSLCNSKQPAACNWNKLAAERWNISASDEMKEFKRFYVSFVRLLIEISIRSVSGED